ncbi:hypothetical protein MRX96_053906, partial [Rhipicephalus microplus]
VPLRTGISSTCRSFLQGNGAPGLGPAPALAAIVGPETRVPPPVHRGRATAQRQPEVNRPTRERKAADTLGRTRQGDRPPRPFAVDAAQQRQLWRDRRAR